MNLVEKVEQTGADANLAVSNMLESLAMCTMR